MWLVVLFFKLIGLKKVLCWGRADLIPVIRFDRMSSRLWAARAAAAPHRWKGGAVIDSGADSCKPANDEYRRGDSNTWPRGYEPRALPLRHTGESGVLSSTACQILVNLRMMLCSVEVEQTLVPATGFDPVTFRLWGDNHQSFGLIQSMCATDDVVDALPLSYAGWGGFTVATRGIRTRHLWLADMSFANWAMSANSVRTAWSTCSVMHIIRCRFLDDPAPLLSQPTSQPIATHRNPTTHHPWHPFTHASTQF